MDKAAQPKILISIVNWMNYWDTISCVELCKKQDYKDIQILVVDNASVNDSVGKISAAHPDITIYRNKKNTGFGGGHKIAYKVALENDFDAIWLLNPDVIIFKESLRRLVDAYLKNGDALYGGVMIDENMLYKAGGGLMVRDDHSIDRNFDYNKEYAGKPVSELKNKIIETTNVEGASFFIPISITKTIGFLKKKYFMYMEEYEYCIRSNMNKYSCYMVCDSIYKHHEARSLALNDQLPYLKTYYSTRNFILVTTKYNYLSKKKVVKDNNGIISIIKKLFVNKGTNEYYFALGVFHALIGIHGKVLIPEKFLSVQKELKK